MPKPSKFHKKLTALIGDWSGDEIMHPTPWAPEGGKCKGRYKARAIAGGFGVAQEYEQKMGGKVMFTGHGVLGYDPDEKCYLWHWSDSMGGVSAMVTKGQWQGNKIVWASQSPMGHARYTHTFLRGGKLLFSIETSHDGETWSPMLDGSYTNKASKG